VLFPTIQFALFFAVVWLTFRVLPREGRIWVLLASSLLFYSFWYPVYLLLLLLEIGVNYALLRRLRTSPRPRAVLATSVTFTLGILAWTKYAGFAAQTAEPLLTSALGWTPPVPDVVLPLGISFYSFQIVALAVDTYRDRAAPVVRLSRYALFVCFFPQLIAGPILRGWQLLPQLELGGQRTPERTRRGLWLLVSGLFKKVMVADFLLAPFVDLIFASPGVASAPYHWLAVYSFAFQIYFDFSGYTDMARGLGLLLGFELPLNFREPYLSRDPAEFWRRWHMTLSQWLRDYLYIPLGGNQKGAGRTHINVLLTMLLGGLWHGAAWTFVAWGGLHGMLLVVQRMWGRRPDPERPLSRSDIPRILLFFHLVCALWIFFRAANLSDALVFFNGLAGAGAHEGWPVLQTLVVLLCAALHLLERRIREGLPALRHELDTRAWGALLEGAVLGAVVACSVAVSGAGGEFIYFQF